MEGPSRGMFWEDLGRAVSSEEKAVQLSPQNATYWKRLAQLYSELGRTLEATEASERADALSSVQERL